MRNIQKELDAIKQSVLETVPAEAIYLFGSYAKGTANDDSDIDIYIVVPDDTKKIVKTLTKIRRAIRSKIGYESSLDLIMDHSSRFDNYRNNITLQKTITEEGILIYG